MTQSDALFATGTPVYTESDPVFATSTAASVTGFLTSRWDTAYAWGNHATNGYLKSYAETDPVAATQVWNTAQYPGALLLTGARPMSGDLDVAGNGIVNIPEGGMMYGDGQSVAQKYINATGDTMTGSLDLPVGGLAVGTTQLLVLTDGNVGIGTDNPTNKLAVNGTIKAREVIVTQDGWPDYVFKEGYRLMPLGEVRRFIAKNGHLPGMPSEREVREGGVRIGDMQARLLQKVEELTLYVMELKEENGRLRRRLERQEHR
jgi:hypothetical protein